MEYIFVVIKYQSEERILKIGFYNENTEDEILEHFFNSGSILKKLFCILCNIYI